MKLLLKLWLLTAVALLALGGIAYAQDGSIGPTQPGASDMLWVLLSGTIVPIVVALVTKWDTPSVVKVLLNAVLAVLASSLVVWQTWPNGSELSEFAFAALAAAIASWASYGHVWKKVGVTADNVGIGTKPKAA